MKNNSKFIFCAIACLFLYSSLLAQTSRIFDNIQYEAEAGVILSTSRTSPFWIRTNKYGEVPLESQILTIRGQVRKEYDSTHKFSYGYGARSILNLGLKNQFQLSEYYIKAKYKAIEIYAGRRREIVGLVDSTLTSGSYVWSGNALPIPKLHLSILNYTPIIFKNKIFSIKGQFAHGWFGSGDSTKSFLLNQSSFYVRFGKPAWRFKTYGGINHQVQWGGKPTFQFYDPITQMTVTKYANSFEAFLNIALGLPIRYGDQTFRTGGQVYGEGNRAGNHLGTLDLGIEYEGSNSRIFLYRQSLYDDGSLFFLNNIADGLSGISWNFPAKNSGIKRVVVEYLYTTSQGGPFSARSGLSELRGQDDYFNNGVYEEGWVYKQNTIGTAFLMPLRNSTGLELNGLLATQNPKRIFNTRVKALNISIQSRIRHTDLVTRISASKNLGSYTIEYPISINQFSLLQQITFPVKKYTISSSLAFDGAGLLEKNIGLILLVRRKF